MEKKKKTNTKLYGFLVRHFEIVRSAFAVLLAMIVIGTIVGLTSKQPKDVLYYFFIGPFTSVRRMGTILQMFVPYLFCGLGMMMMQRANKFNMCIDGAFYIAMALASVAALKVHLPAILLPMFCMLVGTLAGTATAAIPATLNYKFNAHIVVCALMLNYVLQYIGRWILLFKINDPSLTYTASYAFPKEAVLSKIIPKTGVHSGLIIALVAFVVIWFIIKKTSLGYSITQVGNNPDYARACGMNVPKIAIISQLIGGALCGLGGAVEVLGTFGQFKSDALLGYGGYGLLISVVGKQDPVKVFFAALFIAYLRAGSALMNANTDIPLEVADVLQGLLVIFLAASMLLSNTKHKWLIKASEIKEGEAA